MENLTALIKPHSTIDKDDIHVSKEIVDRTVWDKLAIENPTHAVISAKDEESEAEKSVEQIADIMGHLNENDVLLDLGAGYGRVAKHLLPKKKLGGYVGVDSSYEMLSLFKRRYDQSSDEQKTPVFFLNADIHTLPLKDNSIDVVIVCAVFLHNHKSVVANAMAEIRRVVKPGGRVLVYSSLPRFATFTGLQGQVYQALLNLLGRPFKNGPVRYYSRREVNRLFQDFAEVELKPVGFTILPKTLIFLPGFLEVIYRVGLANPLNKILEIITPAFVKPYFAVHYDVVAKL